MEKKFRRLTKHLDDLTCYIEETIEEYMVLFESIYLQNMELNKENKQLREKLKSYENT